MDEIGGFALGRISAAVIASRRRHALVSDHLLNCRQVGTGVTLSRRYTSGACRVV
jgi:hypothetical protein